MTRAARHKLLLAKTGTQLLNLGAVGFKNHWWILPELGRPLGAKASVDQIIVRIL